jgi:quinol monooxygenase YgiN
MAEAALLISGRAKPGQRDALYTLYVEHVVPHLAEASAVRSVAWSADRDDHDAYHLFEIFETGSDHRSIVDSDWFQEYTKLAEPLVAEAAKVHRLETRWTKGI